MKKERTFTTDIQKAAQILGRITSERKKRTSRDNLAAGREEYQAKKRELKKPRLKIDEAKN